MSMLSAQCDGLRELALWLDDEFYDAEATKVRDAADTIWELRGIVHKERAEADRLRKLVASVWRLFTEHGAVHPSDLPEVDAVRNDMRELGVEP